MGVLANTILVSINLYGVICQLLGQKSWKINKQSFFLVRVFLSCVVDKLFITHCPSLDLKSITVASNQIFNIYLNEFIMMYHFQETWVFSPQTSIFWLARFSPTELLTSQTMKKIVDLAEEGGGTLLSGYRAPRK